MSVTNKCSLCGRCDLKAFLFSFSYPLMCCPFIIGLLRPKRRNLLSLDFDFVNPLPPNSVTSSLIWSYTSSRHSNSTRKVWILDLYGKREVTSCTKNHRKVVLSVHKGGLRPRLLEVLDSSTGPPGLPWYEGRSVVCDYRSRSRTS